MSWTVPLALEDAVYAAARGVVGDAALATGPLVRAIVDRSQRYTSERDRLAQPADRRGDLAARAVFFTIADAMKIAVPIAELAGRNALPAHRPLRVIDLGAGCGAMSLGLVAALDTVEEYATDSVGAPRTTSGGTTLQIVAIDRDVEALSIAKAAMQSFAGDRVAFSVRTENVVKLAREPLPTADIVVMGTLLNELPADIAISLVERALAAISDDGAVIIVEPALRETSRRLHELRDALLGRANTVEGVHVFAPCTRHGAPCPALANPSDWCHEDRALALPPRTAELARLTHLRDSGMKMSYLVLRKQPRDLVQVADGERAWRVVSNPRIAKGKHEVFGCSDAGRVTLRLLRRNRTADNRDFERAERGDVVVTSAAPDDDRVELVGPVDIQRPADRGPADT